MIEAAVFVALPPNHGNRMTSLRNSGGFSRKMFFRGHIDLCDRHCFQHLRHLALIKRDGIILIERLEIRYLRDFNHAKAN